jgi:hypothetical protein
MDLSMNQVLLSFFSAVSQADIKLTSPLTASEALYLRHLTRTP